MARGDETDGTIRNRGTPKTLAAQSDRQWHLARAAAQNQLADDMAPLTKTLRQAQRSASVTYDDTLRSIAATSTNDLRALGESFSDEVDGFAETLSDDLEEHAETANEDALDAAVTLATAESLNAKSAMEASADASESAANSLSDSGVQSAVDMTNNIATAIGDANGITVTLVTTSLTGTTTAAASNDGSSTPPTNGTAMGAPPAGPASSSSSSGSWYSWASSTISYELNTWWCVGANLGAALSGAAQGANDGASMLYNAMNEFTGDPSTAGDTWGMIEENGGAYSYANVAASAAVGTGAGAVLLMGIEVGAAAAGPVATAAAAKAQELAAKAQEILGSAASWVWQRVTPNSPPDITFGHGHRHLTGSGLSPEIVEAAITRAVREIPNSQLGNHFGWLQVQGQWIQYRLYILSDGTINIGTYVRVPAQFSNEIMP